MISVQKQPVFPILPVLNHRRHPSAPVVVQATRTPGLLSLSKPARPSPALRVQPQQQQQQQQRNRSSPKPKSAPRSPAVVPSSAVLAENEDSRPASTKVPRTSTPDKTSQGRQTVKPKSTPRGDSVSTTSPNGGRRILNRQSSLEIPAAPLSQAEPPTMPLQPLSDPFIDNSSTKNKPPTLSLQPSGKLARRRQQQQKPVVKTNATHAISIPRAKRADGLQSDAPLAAKKGIWEGFPICDDMTEAGDASDYEHSAPVTPTRPRSKTQANGVSNLSSRPTPLVPFAIATPSPARPGQDVFTRGKQGNARRHRRTPSDGVFAMSSDEEANTSSSNSSGPPTPVNNGPLTPNVEALFRLVGAQRRSSFGTPSPVYGSGSASSSAASSLVGTPCSFNMVHPIGFQAKESHEKQFEREMAGLAPYFASSNFQNSPSPDELPPPLFV